MHADKIHICADDLWHEFSYAVAIYSPMWNVDHIPCIRIVSILCVWPCDFLKRLLDKKPDRMNCIWMVSRLERHLNKLNNVNEYFTCIFTWMRNFVDIEIRHRCIRFTTYVTFKWFQDIHGVLSNQMLLKSNEVLIANDAMIPNCWHSFVFSFSHCPCAFHFTCMCFFLLIAASLSYNANIGQFPQKSQNNTLRKLISFVTLKQKICRANQKMLAKSTELQLVHHNYRNFYIHIMFKFAHYFNLSFRIIKYLPILKESSIGISSDWEHIRNIIVLFVFSHGLGFDHIAIMSEIVCQIKATIQLIRMRNSISVNLTFYNQSQ